VTTVVEAAGDWVVVAELDSTSPEVTAQFGSVLAGFLEPGDVVLLEGTLGAGKTLLTRALCAGLGVTDGVSSPSYALVNHYPEGRCPIAHVDLYRLASADDDLESIGIRDLLDGGLVVVIEWPERAPWLAEVASLHVVLRDIDAEQGSEQRRLTVSVPLEHQDARQALATALRSG